MALAEAIRSELIRVLTDGDMTMAKCAQLERLAHAARSMLKAAGGMAVAEAELDDAVAQVEAGVAISPLGSTSLAPAPPAETFGARILQELSASLPAIMELLGKKTISPNPLPVFLPDDPLTLVRAIKEAKDAHLIDVAKKLEQRLLVQSVAAAPAGFEPEEDADGTPVEAPVVVDDMIPCHFIVNGEDVHVNVRRGSSLRVARDLALSASRNTARPGDDWQVRDIYSELIPLEYEVVSEVHMFIHLKVGAGAIMGAAEVS